MPITDSNNTSSLDNTIVVLVDEVTGNTVGITNEREIKISSFANQLFIDGNKTITTTEDIAAVGASNLTNRKSVVIYNRGGEDVYYGTTGVADTTGIVIIKDELVELQIGDNINVYLITKAGTATVTIQEFS